MNARAHLVITISILLLISQLCLLNNNSNPPLLILPAYTPLGPRSLKVLKGATISFRYSVAHYSLKNLLSL